MLPDYLKPGWKITLQTPAQVKLYNKLLLIKVIGLSILLGSLIVVFSLK